MDIKINDRETGRVIFGLFGEIAPKTVENFKHLALEGIDGKTYAGSKFLIAIKKVMILGGDIVNNNGTGSISIYGTFFNDENYFVKADSAGLLMMANFATKNSNGCMFLITTMATPWLNGKNVVFGKVLKGHSIVHKIENLKTDVKDRILEEVIIIRCGIIDITPYYENYKNYELTLWAWIKAGWFPLSFSFVILAFFHYMMMQLNKLQSFK
ncbi:peptidyl-prolyl cis-trans isomerase, rhodopsin-specific isozyme-like isoform X2 [Cylas formicarius]|nr:peptidyl-prolyl cis-trans isomerase, rhodopsin-specific isozyme-like isoform X2 [Cylas formicarius]